MKEPKKEKKTYTPEEFFEEIICNKFSKKEIIEGFRAVEELEKTLKKLKRIGKTLKTL